MHRALALLCLSLLLPGRARGESTSTQYQLENGVRVRLLRDATLPWVGLAVRVDVGSADDPPGFRQLAHISEHAMFEGSRHTAPGEYGAHMDQLGALDINAVTTDDDTVYFSTFPGPALDSVLWLEAERFAYALDGLDEAGARRSLEAVRDELRLRKHRAIVGARLDMATFGEAHPYGRRAAGPGDVDDIDLSDIQWFIQRYYGPANLTLAVVGDFQPDSVRATISRTFGKLRGYHGAISRPRPPAPRLKDSPVRTDWPANLVREQLALQWLRRPEFPKDTFLLLAAALEYALGKKDFEGVSVWAAERRWGGTLGVLVTLPVGVTRNHGARMVASALAQVCKGLSERVVEEANRQLEAERASPQAPLWARARDLARPPVGSSTLTAATLREACASLGRARAELWVRPHHGSLADQLQGGR